MISKTKNTAKKIFLIILILCAAFLMITPISGKKTMASSLRIAICSTYSEYYQADADLITAIRSFGATVTKVSSSVNVANYDALVIPGGIDIDPSMYGSWDYACWTTDISYDREQYAIMDKFVKAGKPILGVCRGLEFINVYFGGTLYQNVDGHYCWHTVNSLSGSHAYAAVGSNANVRSQHHQAIKTLGTGLKATQWASDGIIEAIEHTTLPIIGVLWHPEWTSSKSPLISYFLNKIVSKYRYGSIIKNNGKWVYVNPSGKIDYSYTGVMPNEAGWWYVKKVW